MKIETYETLKSVIEKTEKLLNEKYNKRKRLTKNEIWEKATTIRDIRDAKVWFNIKAKIK